MKVIKAIEWVPKRILNQFLLESFYGDCNYFKWYIDSIKKKEKKSHEESYSSYSIYRIEFENKLNEDSMQQIEILS